MSGPVARSQRKTRFARSHALATVCISACIRIDTEQAPITVADMFGVVALPEPVDRLGEFNDEIPAEAECCRFVPIRDIVDSKIEC